MTLVAQELQRATPHPFGAKVVTTWVMTRILCPRIVAWQNTSHHSRATLKASSKLLQQMSMDSDLEACENSKSLAEHRQVLRGSFSRILDGASSKQDSAPTLSMTVH
mmetsp:Transcript_19955/g.37069  ORF Transcript_19955/g.37069 Transcript_19955/m.37069 type:complete len:107 (+) Transcript_19955:1235-1555(+)